MPVLKSITIIFSAFIRPFQSPQVFTPYGVSYAIAQAPLVCSLYTSVSYMSYQCLSSQYYVAVNGFLVLFCTLLWPLSLSYYCLYQALTRLLSSSIQAWALTQRHSSFTLFTYFAKISSLLQGCWFILLQGALRSLYSLFRYVLMYFITLKLHSFYILYIAIALIYNYRGGTLASFLSSTVAIRLYPPVILQRQAV